MGNRLSWNWVLLLLLISSLYGGNTGKITGTVVDKETGDPLIGANVILDGTELGSSTDVDGFYSIINAPPGNYTLMAYYVGYATVVVENVRVNVDRTTRITVTMSPETVAGEEVLVEAQRPAIEMDRTHSASVVSSETVELMPVTELSEVLELQAGVVSSDGNLHFRGGRAREVTYIVDGVPITNAFNQDGGNSVVVENSMIEELEVISGTFNAEYGQAQSGVVNITTKRPARQFSGSVETYIGEYLSNQDDVYLGISDFDPLAERDLQLNLSGPILKDKLGFSFSGRYSLFESPDWYEKRYSPLDGWRVAAYDRWFVQANQSDLDESGVIPIPDSLTTGDGSRGPLLTAENMSMNFKLLFQPHPKVSFTYQTFGSTREFEGIPGADLRATNFLRRFQPDGYGTARSWQYSHFFRFQHFPSENFFYNLGASYQHEDGEYYLNKENKIARYPGDDGIMLFSSFTGPYAIGTIPIFYGGADDRGFVDQWLLNGDFNWQVNKSNFIKGGFLVKQHFINIYARGFLENEVWRDTKWLPEFENLIGPLGITFDQYWNIMSDYWRNWEANTNSVRYRQVEADDAGNFRDFNIYPMEMAFFLQDKIEMGDIIVNAGLRADIFQPNEVVPINLRTESFNLGAGSNLEDATIKYQLSPRLGVSFPISASGAFHASYGHFFQMPSFAYMFNEPLNVLTPFQLEGRTMGNANLEAERTIAYEIGLQQAVNDQVAVNVTVYHKDFRNLLGIEQLTTVDNIAYQRYVNRDYGASKGFSLEITKSGGLITGGANYAFSFSDGSSSDPNSLELINTAISIGGDSEVFAERRILPLNWDQRHTFNAYINMQRKDNWSVGLVGYMYSGQPYSPTFVERFDLSDREYRSLGNKPVIWNVDLKAKKQLKFFGLKGSLFLKVDNLFDNLNEENVFSSTGRADQIARLPEVAKLLVQEIQGRGLLTLKETDIRPHFFSTPRKLQLGVEWKF